ncbi:MAG: thioredoxin family protein [Saprospiraceae bacterium]|nr:thioredoxin family protein [Saprospiraceae bacterium]
MKNPLLLPVTLVACLLLMLSNTTPKGYTVGDIAEEFSLKNVTGDTVSLSDYSDAKGVIVIFTCNHCPFAQLYEQRVIDLHRMFAPLGFPVVAINPNSPLITPEDSFEKMQERAKQKHYPFAYLFDEEQTVFPKFGATRTPHVFVLDGQRSVRYIGAIDNNPESPNASTQRFVENAVNALLKGEKPNPDFTKSNGCTVKKAPPPRSAVPNSVLTSQVRN